MFWNQIIKRLNDRRDRNMNKKFLVTFISCIITIAIIISSCSKSADNAETTSEKRGIPVKVIKVQPQSFVEQIQIVGTAKAFEDVKISAEEGGVIKQWLKSKGSYVQKGEIIALLKDEVILGSYEAAKAQYEIAELNLQKQQKVYEQQGISELQYKTLLYNRDAAKANLEIMKARWERTQIKSPVNGILENRFFEEGEYAPPATPLARVVNTSLIKIFAEIPELISHDVRVGMQARIVFDAFPADTFSGTVTFVGSTVSPANRSMPIEIILANPKRTIKPEMISKILLQKRIKKQAILVNEDYIQLVDRQRQIVYVV